MRLSATILIFLLGISLSAVAQSRKKKNREDRAGQTVPPTSLHPTQQPERAAPRASGRNAKGPTYESEQKYYERMEALAKEKRRAGKLMLKPQYSDPLYFGHKRPPKKRKPGKMKFCKECGIRH